jgi:DNA-binding NtrC family response regulator
MDSEKPTILIVDDDRAIRALLQRRFSDEGYGVRTASNAVEAMQICAAESFDAVLSDVRMPGQSGHDLARWLAERHPATQPILMTGWDTACEDCPISGRCQMLAKPFHPNDAVSLVKAVLARSLKKPST